MTDKWQARETKGPGGEVKLGYLSEQDGVQSQAENAWRGLCFAVD